MASCNVDGKGGGDAPLQAVHGDVKTLSLKTKGVEKIVCENKDGDLKLQEHQEGNGERENRKQSEQGAAEMDDDDDGDDDDEESGGEVENDDDHDDENDDDDDDQDKSEKEDVGEEEAEKYESEESTEETADTSEEENTQNSEEDRFSDEEEEYSVEDLEWMAYWTDLNRRKETKWRAQASNLNEATRELLKAAMKNQCDRVEWAQLTGPDWNGEDNEGNTPLNCAASNGCLRCMEIIIKAGADVNKSVMKLSGSGGKRKPTTAMLAAAEKGRARCIYALLKAGAKVDDDSFLEVAGSGDEKCLAALIKAGANVNAADDRGYTALITAAGSGHVACVDLLLKKGANVNASYSFIGHVTLSSDGVVVDDTEVEYRGTALSQAAETPMFLLSEKLRSPAKWVKCVKSLLRAGAHVNIEDGSGNNSLQNKIVNTKLEEMLNPTNKKISMLLFAAGEAIDEDQVFFRMSFNHEDVIDYETPAYLFELTERKLCLKDLCRQTVRKRLLEVDPHENLFQRVPKLELPSLLIEYLLYDMSVEDSACAQ